MKNFLIIRLSFIIFIILKLEQNKLYLERS